MVPVPMGLITVVYCAGDECGGQCWCSVLAPSISAVRPIHRLSNRRKEKRSGENVFLPPYCSFKYSQEKIKQKKIFSLPSKDYPITNKGNVVEKIWQIFFMILRNWADILCNRIKSRLRLINYLQNI